VLKFGLRGLCVRLHWRTCDVALRLNQQRDRESHRSIRERQTDNGSRGSAFYEIIGDLERITGDYHKRIKCTSTETTALIKRDREISGDVISRVLSIG